MSRSVFVVGLDSNVRNMFSRAGWSLATDLKKADAVCFTGGGDVSPMLYGQRLHPTTYPSFERDMEEVAIWKSLPTTKPKFGICRGMQLGNILSGGSMWQNLDNHRGGLHRIIRYDSKNDGNLYVNSLHHQAIKPTQDAIIIAVADEATVIEDAHQSIRKANLKPEDHPEEVEAVYYYHTNFLGVQWHPELTDGAGTSNRLFFELIDEYIHDRKKGAN